MFNLLSAVAIGAGLGYARKACSRIEHSEKLDRQRGIALEKLQTAHLKEVGAVRVLSVLLRRPMSDDIRAELQEKAAKHELRAIILQGQIEELSVPTVYPV